ncbi:MAG: type II CAAX endopeptidase family protein [Candidatus Omnitrophota bacterium]
MSRLTEVRQWVQEEKRYLWIVICLVLFHTGTSILDNFTRPLESAASVAEESLVIKEEQMLKLFREDASLWLLFVFLGLFVFLAMLVGLYWGIRFLWLKRKGKFSIRWRLPEQKILWSIRDVFRLTVIVVLFSYVIEILQFVLFRFVPEHISEGIRLLTGTLATQVIALFLIFRLVRLRKGQMFSHLGLSAKAFSRNIVFGLQSYVSLLPVLFLALFVSIVIAEVFRLNPPPQPIQELFKEGTPQKIFLTALVLVTLVGPVVEEIFFRGFLYSALKMKWGKGWAVFASGFLFALLHANWVALLPIALLGCALAYIYELTGSLVASITIHVLHNALVMTVFLLAAHFSRLAGI